MYQKQPLRTNDGLAGRETSVPPMLKTLWP